MRTRCNRWQSSLKEGPPTDLPRAFQLLYLLDVFASKHHPTLTFIHGLMSRATSSFTCSPSSEAVFHVELRLKICLDYFDFAFQMRLESSTGRTCQARSVAFHWALEALDLAL